MASALRTYLFTDLLGYGDVLLTSDAAAAQLLRAYRRVIRGVIPRPPAATEQEAVADAFQFVFRSPGRAVQTAMEIVKAAEHHNARTRSGLILRIGIGIHAGETVREGRDFVGSAVVVAVGLSHAAQAGQILISDTIHALLRTANIGRMNDLGVWGRAGSVRRFMSMKSRFQASTGVLSATVRLRGACSPCCSPTSFAAPI
jgi:class 3 adenylate cyclase